MAGRHSTIYVSLAAAMIFLGVLHLSRQGKGITMMAPGSERYKEITAEDQTIMQEPEPLDTAWWTPFVNQMARPFSILPKDPFWCVPRPILEMTNGDNITTASNKGLYLVKIPKTASSTAAGVTIQIARNTAARMASQTTISDSLNMECMYHIDHGMAHVDRQDPFFLWTVVRHPAQRAVSHYFFGEVSRRGAPFTSDGMIASLKRHVNFQFRQLARKRVDDGNATLVQTRYHLESPRTTPKNVLDMIQTDILENFHFIGISERLDESLVALKMILNLNMEDVIGLSSKISGKMDDGGFDGTCHNIQTSRTTAEVDQYLSQEFRIDNYDFFLYDVANRSLDLTIDAFGREPFRKELEKYHAMKQYAEEQCLSKVLFPCTEVGQPPWPEAKHSCFKGDIGCGHECVQQALREFATTPRYLTNRRK
ncbi:sulfotransferase family protein [Nitzschia inconspicua]|uniref:Sulfotransferase family protein n=1 Tax=Nitzschia inconspicua TaxID=303405 RepID=A0A9K3PJT2_9STRA|nr:sulfotransferase family protein [Nitzschia inconspicua]